MPDPLSDLLSRPVEPTSGRARWVWLALGVSLGAAAVIGVLVFLNGQTGQVPPAPGVSTTSTSTTTVAEPLQEVAFDQPYLFLPRVLPAGMDLCEPPSGQSARFCGDVETTRITIQLQEFSPSRMSSGVPVSGWSAAKWLELGDTLSLGVGVEGVMGLTVTGTGTTEDQLVAVARSVPLVTDDSDLFRLDMEDPLSVFTDITDEVAASILGIDISEVYRGGSGWVPRTNTDNLRLLVDSSPSLLSYAATVRYPLAITDLGVPAVAGMGTGSQEHVSRIFWSQRGLVWTLQSNQPLDRLADLVISAIQVIGEL